MGHFQIPPPSGHFPLYFMQQDRRGDGRARGRVRRNTGRGWGPTSLADAILWSSSRKNENSESGWKTLRTWACLWEHWVSAKAPLLQWSCEPPPLAPSLGCPVLEDAGQRRSKGYMGKEVGRGGKAAEIHNCLGEGTRETCALVYRLQG